MSRAKATEAKPKIILTRTTEEIYTKLVLFRLQDRAINIQLETKANISLQELVTQIYKQITKDIQIPK